MNEIDTQRQEELAHLEQAARIYARHEADSRLKRYMRSSLAGFVVLAAGLALAIHGNAEVAHEAKQASAAAATTKSLKSAAFSECKRVNILRAQSNVSNDVSFVILSASAQRELTLAKKPPSSAVHRRSGLVLASQAARLKVTRLTDCARAVNQATDYKFPLAGPIGDALTGKQHKGVKDILVESERVVNKNSKDTR